MHLEKLGDMIVTLFSTIIKKEGECKLANMFVNLHVHSQYSLLDSCLRYEDLVQRNKELTEEFNQRTGESHQAYSCITDHGNLYAVMFHYNEAKKNNVIPIIGEEFYVTDDMYNKDAEHHRQYKNEHMIILAKNNEGYKRLSKLASLAATEGFYYKARVDDKCIENVGTDNLIATSACVAGRIPRCILNDDIAGAKKWIAYYDKLFQGNFYLEIQPTAIDHQIIVNKVLIELSKEMGIPLVATTDAHYLTQKYKNAHDTLLCMQSKDVMSNPDRWTYGGNTYYIMSKEEILNAFKQSGHENLDQNAILQAVEQTEDIAKQCLIEFEEGKHYLPSVEIPTDDKAFNEWKEKATIRKDDLDKTKYLEYLFMRGLTKKQAQSKKDRIRMAHEMQVIKEMGFETYFLLYSGLIDFIRNQAKIPCGPGRGCFKGNNLVLTNNGLKQIQDIDIGEFVYTKDEKLHEIINKFIYDVDEELLQLQVEDKFIDGITKDHKILAIKAKDFDNGIRVPQWIEADKLKINDIICEVENEDFDNLQ